MSPARRSLTASPALFRRCPLCRVAALAIEARSQMHLCHVPLFLVREMSRHTSHRPLVRATQIVRGQRLRPPLSIRELSKASLSRYQLRRVRLFCIH